MKSRSGAAREIPGMTSHWVADEPGAHGLSQAVARAGECVAIVTAQGADGSLVGACCAALPLLAEAGPPALAWALAPDTPGLPVFAHATHIALNFLTAGDADTAALAQRFAGQRNDKFSALAFEFGLGGAPLLERAVLTFECENRPLGMADVQGRLQFTALVRRYRQACLPAAATVAGSRQILSTSAG